MEAKSEKNSETAIYGCPSKLCADESQKCKLTEKGPKKKNLPKKYKKRKQLSELNVNIIEMMVGVKEGIESGTRQIVSGESYWHCYHGKINSFA